MDAKGQYSLVEDDESLENGTCSSDFTLDIGEEIGSLPHRLRVVAIVEAFLLAIALAVFFYALATVGPLDGHDLIVATNAYSPLLDRTTVNFETVWVKTALVNKHNIGGPSIYREPPSPEVDEAWRALHKGDRLFLIEEHEVRRMGKNPDYVIKAPDEWGMGSNQYLAVNQGQHDIHCLNNLRKFAYSDYYYGNRTEELEIHALHCLHALLQTFQCKFSTDVYTAFWVEGYEPPAVDFNTSRKCQIYDNIMHWSPQKPYTDEQFASLRVPPDAIRIPKDIY